MKFEDYEYDEFAGEEILTDDRKEMIINRTKAQIVKGSIALYKILRICKNNQEFEYIYKWLAKNDITIRGINITLSEELEELENYEQIQRYGEVELPKELEEEEQQRLFLKLNDMKKSGVDINSKEYQDIRQKLIIHNMKLALWAVNVKFGKSLKNLNFEKDDLENIALESLIKSVDNFDASYGYKFSTYAVSNVYYSVRHKWREEINHSQAKEKEWKKLEELEEKMLITENRLPTDEEIKENLGIGDEGLKTLKQYINYHLREPLGSLTEYDQEDLISNLLDDERLEEKDSKPILNGIYIDEKENAIEEDTIKVDIAAETPIMKQDVKKI